MKMELERELMGNSLPNDVEPQIVEHTAPTNMQE